MFKEVRIHGRGGQGAVTSSQVLAIAAFNDGMYSQAFPWFGVERSGAPVQSFVRISDRKVMTRQFVYAPDYVMVLEPTLIKNVEVTKGLKESGMLIVNSNKSAKELGIEGKFTTHTIDITKLAMEIMGKPFVNIATLGAFCALTGIVSIDALEKAIEERFKYKRAGKTGEINKNVARKVFESCTGGTC